MSKNEVRNQRDKLRAQLEAVERELGHEPDVIDAEIVELPEDAGSESRHPSDDSKNRSPAENDSEASTDAPMERSEVADKGHGVAAVCLPARIERPAPPQYSEEWWQTSSPGIQARRCKGHLKNGEQCHKPAIRGAAVCRTHGGAAPQVIAAARARLANAADSMASNLVGLAKTAESEAVRVRATEGVLDRVGIGRTTEVQVGPTKVKPYEEIFADIAGGSRAESRARRGIDDQSYNNTYGYGDDPGAGIDTSEQSRRYMDGYGEGGEHSEPSFHPPSQGEPDTRAAPMTTPPAEQRPSRHRAPRYVDEYGERYDDDEAAVYMARQANEACGALPEQRALESRHKRYRRPW